MSALGRRKSFLIGSRSAESKKRDRSQSTFAPLGLRDGAPIAEVSIYTLRREALRGVIPHQRLFGRIVFQLADLEEYASRLRERKSRKVPPTQIRTIAAAAARQQRQFIRAFARGTAHSSR